MNGRSIYIILQYMLMLAPAGAAFDGTCFPFELVVFPRQLLGCFWLIVNWLWRFLSPSPPFSFSLVVGDHVHYVMERSTYTRDALTRRNG